MGNQDTKPQETPKMGFTGLDSLNTLSSSLSLDGIELLKLLDSTKITQTALVFESQSKQQLVLKVLEHKVNDRPDIKDFYSRNLKPLQEMDNNYFLKVHSYNIYEKNRGFDKYLKVAVLLDEYSYNLAEIIAIENKYQQWKNPEQRESLKLVDHDKKLLESKEFCSALDNLYNEEFFIKLLFCITKGLISAYSHNVIVSVSEHNILVFRDNYKTRFFLSPFDFSQDSPFIFESDFTMDEDKIEEKEDYQIRKQLCLKKEIYELSQMILKIILKEKNKIKAENLLENINKIKEDFPTLAQMLHRLVFEVWDKTISMDSILDDPLYNSINAKYQLDEVLLQVNNKERYIESFSQIEFGYIYNTLEKYEASIKWFSKAVPYYQGKEKDGMSAAEWKTFGNMLECLGENYAEIQSLERAIEHLEKAINIKRQIYKNDPKQLAMAYSVITILFQLVGETKKANQLIDQTVNIYKNLYGATSKQYYEKRCLIHRYFLPLKRDLLGQESTYYANFLVVLAFDYCHLDEKVCGLAYARKAQYMLENKLNSEENITTFYDIANLLYYCEEFSDAIKVLKQIQQAQVKLKGEVNIKNAKYLKKLGKVLCSNEEYKSALKYFKQSFTIYQQVLEPTHKKIFSILDLICEAHDWREDFKDSIKYASEKLELMKEKKDISVISIAQQLNYLGKCYECNEDYDQSRTAYEEVLDRLKTFKHTEEYRDANIALSRVIRTIEYSVHNDGYY